MYIKQFSNNLLISIKDPHIPELRYRGILVFPPGLTNLKRNLGEKLGENLGVGLITHKSIVIFKQAQ